MAADEPRPPHGAALHDAPYRRFFEDLSEAAYVVDQETGLLLAVNASAARMYGYTVEELVGQPAKMISSEPEKTHAAVTSADVSERFRLHKRKDGSVFPIESQSSLSEWGGRKARIGIIRDVSATRRIERELLDSRRLLKNAFDDSPLMMLISELESARNLDVNEAFCRTMGYAREDVVGRVSTELGIIEVASRQAITEALLRDGRINGLEIKLRRKDGALLDVRAWAELIETPEGRRLFAACEDMTERKAAERARAEVSARLEKLASRVPGVVYQFRLRPDGSVTVPYASPGIRDLFGVELDDLAADARGLFARIHPDDLPHVQERIAASAHELTPWSHEFRVRLDDGERWLLGNSMPEREADGGTLWHGFITDVTERRRLDEARKESEERFTLAMDATTDALWDWDLATGSAYVSPNYYRMLGYAPGELNEGLGAWADLIHPDDRERSNQSARDCIEGRVDRFETDYRLKHKDGDWRWIHARGKVVRRDASGRALRVLGTNVDITERRRLQAGLAQSDRLTSMGMLAAGVAHEINNPLAYVLANLDVLSQELPQLVGFTKRCVAMIRQELGEARLASLVADAAEVVSPGELDELVASTEAALEGTRRIRKISRGLGTFARVERAEVEAVDLNLALETAATMAQNEVKFRATLVKDLGRLPLVLGSDGKLAQVFLNLIINAAHAIPEGHVDRHRITLRTWAEGGRVFAEVGDTGHGIDPAHLERIFEPFFTTKPVGVGSGLGLAITRNLVTEFSGQISVESEVGHGTRFRVSFPEFPEPALHAAPPAAQAAPKPPRARVLVVDDEAPIRRALARVLSKDHELVAVASGREARDLLERDRAFDLILCDLMMPDMTGMELHAWLNDADPALAQRVVFCSGGAFTPHASEYLERVGNPRLEKPFDQAQLKALVAQRVAQPGARAPAR